MRFFLFFVTALFFWNTSMGQRCATTQYLLEHPIPIRSATTPTDGSGGRDTLPNQIITVPVVVHVLYNVSDQNISDAQVLSQITSLNNDFRRLNADTVNTPAPFKSVAADARIQFCLAKTDPNGNYTTGIIRKYTTQTTFLADDEMKFDSTGGDNAWDRTKYLNIWVCNLFGRVLGYAVMPGGPANTDGIVIQYDAFGTIGNVIYPFNDGRTTTHEIGHWLGLRHVWGDAICGDDGIADTPPQETYSTGCPTFPRTSSCSINPYGDMFMNYMDFTNDACMNMFTHDQVLEMRGMFALGGYRNSFLNASACDSSTQEGPTPSDTASGKLPPVEAVSIKVFPNPFIDQIFISSDNSSDLIGMTAKLYDVTGKLYKVQVLGAKENILYVFNLPGGMYFLKLEGNNNTSIFKLIK
jgi:Pregnancy-associated plasma protein-A/Secretion system C-terminal sorting domain